MRCLGYRAVFIWGLFLYGAGALVAIPAIKLHSFEAFCVCVFTMGSGLGAIETAASPYVTACGPTKFAEIRITTSQALSGIGSVMAPLLGSYIFFDCDDYAAHRNVQWVHLAIGACALTLAMIFLFVRIPEITDTDMIYQVAEAHTVDNDLCSVKKFNLIHATFAQFCFTGAQITLTSHFIDYVTETQDGFTTAQASRLLAGAQGVYLASRLAGIPLMHLFKPRTVFGVYLTLCIVFIVPAMTRQEKGGLAFLYVTFFFASVCFPSILGLGMRGLGRDTKRGSGWIIAGILGGAIAPLVTSHVGDMFSSPVSMVVPLSLLFGALSYAIAVNFVPRYKNIIDAYTPANVASDPTNDSAEDVRSQRARTEKQRSSSWPFRR
ncbi:hypothetical protein ED733_001108 [Metarhizium rileyi]|uniref:Major facilitator superfamily domain, general substrate transporter n=1 Tax=Metarhizium rileyi (strain RCEF 4871) TaxID=1649241 RepID=A0A5C6GF46_METRR|nr:hypothetical protein ED733_001108 [Metarhizium rileyi]